MYTMCKVKVKSIYTYGVEVEQSLSSQFETYDAGNFCVDSF